MVSSLDATLPASSSMVKPSASTTRVDLPQMVMEDIGVCGEREVGRTKNFFVEEDEEENNFFFFVYIFYIFEKWPPLAPAL